MEKVEEGNTDHPPGLSLNGEINPHKQVERNKKDSRGPPHPHVIVIRYRVQRLRNLYLNAISHDALDIFVIHCRRYQHVRFKVFFNCMNSPE